MNINFKTYKGLYMCTEVRNLRRDAGIKLIILNYYINITSTTLDAGKSFNVPLRRKWKIFIQTNYSHNIMAFWDTTRCTMYKVPML